METDSEIKDEQVQMIATGNDDVVMMTVLSKTEEIPRTSISPSS